MMAKKLWIIASSLILLFWLLTLPWVPVATYKMVLAMVSLIFISYIAMKIPEGMLISHTQITRAIYLYQKVQRDDTDIFSHGPDSLIDYLKNLPEDIIKDRSITL